MQNKPGQHLVSVVDAKYVSSKALELTFKPEEEINFEPGQYLNIEVAEGIFRSYSISSHPANTKEIKIVAAVTHEGVGSNYLKKLKKDDKVSVIGPSGRFRFQSDEKVKNVIFVATGTGISPFISMLYELKDHKFPAEMHLYFGVRNDDEVFYMDELEEFKKDLDFEYTVCVSQHSTNPLFKQGRVTDYIAIADPQNTHVYLCGHPAMIEDVSKKLIDLGVPEENIFHEKYTRSEK